ncbi:MAG: hypothetical protein AUJ85_09135 [Elusimicrobia bacterium CG1_02_37_114]|nr:MAG: hypothetical protein AUJ85_09135 [Elusimicrobia bacterium CG1_02_37_114]PIV53459.1 MAG: FmdB family transcriptional regulator [Elusimicrobia bacterium CG02_land_8_20_14_3_00_37_13]PIZ12744.1 MAG: FmdB family transcriptional regulator [Elusimicrobia bacterium CG_4_10_14_0_8_um_filter_37_32]
MPIYAYQCKKCNNEFELLITDRNEKPKCPKCENKNLERLMSTFAIAGTSKGSSSGSGSNCSCCSSKNCSSCG